MSRLWLCLAAVNGFLAVAAGAFGVHGLGRAGLANAEKLFETASRYQALHALALIAVAWLASVDTLRNSFLLKMAGATFLAGIILFSGSLYAFALSGFHILVFVTPIGGLAFMAGWLALALVALKLP